MRDERVTKLANGLLDYSVKIKRGERIYIEWKGDYTTWLAKALIKGTTERGATPIWFYNDESILRQMIKYCDVDQVKSLAECHLDLMKKSDAYIGIRGSNNAFDLADVPDEKMEIYKKHFTKPVHMEERLNNTRWCVMRYPNNAMAQLAETSQEKFEDFYFDVCTMDYARMSKAMDPLKELMEKTDKVHLKGPAGTDLTFSIKGIPSVKCDGHKNIPDGEIYTAPVRDSINGTIAFNTPALYEGKVYNDIRFTFEKGKIVKATCPGADDAVNKILDTDEGGRYVGEFAFGVNPYIRKAMKDTLFDEKIYGSIHLTPGNSYEDADNKNKSAIHWDLVLIQTPEFGGGEIHFDGKLIRKDGEFVHGVLKDVLSAEALTR